METRAYHESYVNHAMVTLGTMLDFAVNYQRENIDRFFDEFLQMGVAQLFERGNPMVLAGKSGVELYRMVKQDDASVWPDYVEISRSPEYWAGWSLAYFQWYSNRTFQEIVAVAPVSELVSWYGALHEADVMRFVDRMNMSMKRRQTNLELLRKRAELSQAQLASLSGVSIRSIQLYEQRRNDISKAQYNILCALAQVLQCSVSDFMDDNLNFYSKDCGGRAVSDRQDVNGIAVVEGRLVLGGNLIKRAYELAQSDKERQKAAEALMVLDDLLIKRDGSFFNPFTVDKRLREEYPLIEELEAVEERHAAGMTVIRENWNDRLLRRLFSDQRGVCADVLVRHKVIRLVADSGSVEVLV